MPRSEPVFYRLTHIHTHSLTHTHTHTHTRTQMLTHTYASLIAHCLTVPLWPHCSTVASPFQVLSKALEVWGLTTTPITSPDVPEVAHAPEKETAFICNLQVRARVCL